MALKLLLSIAIFASCGAAAVAFAQLLSRHSPGEDGETRRSKLHPAVSVACMALVGLILALRGADTLQLAIVAVVGIPLAGSWYSDSHDGRIPDAFTLLPLAAIGIYVVLHHAWPIAFYAAATFAAFGCAALLSRGKGMGWGDAKLAGVAGGILGLPWSFGVLGTACLAATVVSIVRDRGKAPIAFAPYIAVSVLAALSWMVHG